MSAAAAAIAGARATLRSVITCPECGHAAEATMPTDACQWFYECGSCKAVLRPKAGDCCVFCSYGTVLDSHFKCDTEFLSEGLNWRLETEAFSRG